jgi:hypothetical protein
MHLIPGTSHFINIQVFEELVKFGERLFVVVLNSFCSENYLFSSGQIPFGFPLSL